MRFRIESTLGWMMLTGLGNELVPGAFKPELVPEPPLMQGRGRGMTEGLYERAQRQLHPAQRRHFDEATTLHGHARLTELGLDAPEPEVTTYRTDSSLWWLSWAADGRGCAGIAVVEVEGEQSGEAAARVAARLGLHPAGEWQIAAIQIPEEHRAEHAPLVGRFLTPSEAEAALAAQSIKSYEHEHGVEITDAQLADAGIEVVG